MTTSPHDAVATPRFRLLTLGTLRLLSTAEETILGEHGHHRRRLALLAVVAAAGDRGRSRDQLLGLFWPDVSQSRARHSLEQLIYAVRTSLDGPVFAGTNPLVLNTAFVSSDIADYLHALAGEDRERAVELYAGPFLDGFYLDNAPDFQQWLDSERARIEASYSAALDGLAKSAHASGDAAAAVRWRQKLVELDPVSSKHATGLIQALMDAGDHPAALKYAEHYEALVAQELGTTAGPAVTALVAQLRERVRSGSVPAPMNLRESGASPDVESPVPDVREVRIAVPHSATGKPAAQDATRMKQPGGEGVPRRWGLYAVAVLLLLAVAFAAMKSREPATASEDAAARASLAVLPLQNLSGDTRDAALVDGLTEELIGVLARIEGLRVVARTSAFAFRGTSLDVRGIADSLRVSNVIEGSVQRNGDRLRVQVRLIDARDGSTRWAETYDRNLSDIFVVQSDIATAVAGELNLRLASDMARLGRPGAVNIAAYELTLRGNDPALLRSDTTVVRGLEYFQQAVAIDSTYAPAYAGMSRMYLRLRWTDLLPISSREKYERARDAALKAIALDPSLADAHASVGLMRLASGEVPAGITALKQAVALDPGHSRIREWLSFGYSISERPAEALAETMRAVENDPLSATAHAEAGRALCLNGQVAEGLARLNTLDAIRPPLARVTMYKAMCHGVNRDWQAASEILPRADPRIGAALLGHTMARVGKKDSAQAILGELTRRWERTRDAAFLIAIIHAGFGDHDKAFEWLNRSIDEASISPQLMAPFFDDMKADPRYAQFLRRLGIQKR